jgi:predicted transglutaminase-like cysteine proteinase
MEYNLAVRKRLLFPGAAEQTLWLRGAKNRMRRAVIARAAKRSRAILDNLRQPLRIDPGK